MAKAKKIMLACVENIMGGHLWLQYSKNDKHIDIELHAKVLDSS